jgi:hypothetical protein
LITQNDDARKECSEQELLNTAAASAAAYHELYERDEFAWHEMGRELVESEDVQSSKTVTLSVPDNPGTITVTAVLTASKQTNYSVTTDDGGKSGVIRTNTDEQVAMFETATFQCNGSGSLPVTIKCVSGGPIKIDYVLATFSNPKGYSALSTAFRQQSMSERCLIRITMLTMWWIWLLLSRLQRNYIRRLRDLVTCTPLTMA